MDPEVALFFYKSVIRLYIEYCCHVWAGTPRCYLNMLLHKRVFRTVIPSLSASLEHLTHYRNVALSLSYRYYFSRSSHKLAKMIWLLILEGFPLAILLGCMIFLSPFRDFISMSMSTVSFLAQLDSSPAECFPLTYGLNGFKSRVNRYFLSAGSFSTDFLFALHLYRLLFLTNT